jgi:nitroreductase
MENIIEKLNWRYAVKSFDTNRKLTTKQIDFLKEALNLTASSLGLQPYKILIIEDEETKKKLLPLSYDQNQITSASHLFLFCAIKNVDEKYADNYIEHTAKTRNATVENIKDYAEMVKGFIRNYDYDQKLSWASKQAYIALGNLLTVCALEQIDACPMEGFSPEDYEKTLGLDKLGLKALALVATGYRSPDDKYQHLKKVRKPDLFL